MEQPAHKGQIDIDEALAVATPLLETWWAVRAHPDSPPFSGGVYDGWPARDAEVIAYARAEEYVISEWQWHLQTKGRGDDGSPAETDS